MNMGVRVEVGCLGGGGGRVGRSSSFHVRRPPVDTLDVQYTKYNSV